jgi:hypothetical protein
MSDTTDDMEAYSGLIPDDENDHEDSKIKRHAVIEYCYDHLDKMWAAKVVSILLGCDFRNAKEHADLFFEHEEYEGR